MYLTKAQREMILIAGIAGGASKEWVQQCPDLTPDERRRLRTAHTNIDKAVESYLSRLDPDARKRLYKDLHENVIQVAVDRNIAKQSSERLVKEDDVYTLAEFAIADTCQVRERCPVEEDGKNFRKCRLYQAMISLGLARASYVKGQCPYKL